MKKYIPFILGFVAGILPLQAVGQTLKDTTFQFNNKVIHVEDSIGQVKIKVYDNDSLAYKPV